MTTNKHNSGKFILTQFLLFILVAAGMAACNLIPTKEKADKEVVAEPLPDKAASVTKTPGQIWLDKISAIKNTAWAREYCQKIYKSYTVKFGEPVLAESDVVRGEYEKIVTYDNGDVYSSKYGYETASENKVKLISVIHTDKTGKQTDGSDFFHVDGKVTLMILEFLDDGNMLVLGGAHEIYVKK